MFKKQMSTGRRALLLGMGGLTFAGGIKYLNNQLQALAGERNLTITADTALRDRATAKGLIYGATASRAKLSSDREFARRFAQECGILVPEWELKWETLRPNPDRFDFSKGDWLFEFARKHNMLFRGHTLLWHKSMPQWFSNVVTRQNAKQVMLKHITTVAQHYAGKVHSWDVVNEAVLPQDGRSDGLRHTPWLQLLGRDYIEIAFRAAAEADPQALLVYNDYGLEYDTEDDEARRTAVLKLLERLKSRSVPVQALGIQAHLWANGRDQFNPKKHRAFLQDVADMGLKILITELDVADQGLPKNIDQRDRLVAAMYADYLAVALDQPAVIAVLTWGLSDRYTWLSQEKPRQDGAPVRPLPLDAEMRRKLAWHTLSDAFNLT